MYYPFLFEIKQFKQYLKKRKLEKLYYECLIEDDRLNNFFKFECNEFFRGSLTSERNRYIYDKNMEANRNKLSEIKKEYKKIFGLDITKI